jgi:hypothetical protein
MKRMNEPSKPVPVVGANASPARAPTLRREFLALPVWQKTLAVVMTLYILAVSVHRFSDCLDPWVAETDWKQWVWQYWRYHIPGAFPEGHVITDYTFNAQPPLYHFLMSSFCRMLTPVVACNVVNWIAWALAVWACVIAVRGRSHLLVGLMCAMLFVRDEPLHRATMGGYPRSFAPTLTLLFLAAWLNGRHRLVLLVLVLAAATYPSVCVPCGLAYGLWTAATSARSSWRAWLRPNLEVLATGALVTVLGVLQSITAPKWWGPVVWAEDAVVELSSRGRSAWLPLAPYWPKVARHTLEPWSLTGAWWKDGVIPWSESLAQEIGFGAALAVFLAGVIKSRRSPIPAQMFLMFGCALFGYFVARELAFKLYLPHRIVQHTLPVILFVMLSLLYFQAGTFFFQKKSRAVAFALIGLILPQFLFSGDGFGASEYPSYAEKAELYTWIRENTDVGDQFGGYYSILDEIPFFSARQVFVNWKMAHPFRKGYFAEVDRRTFEMYAAYYCTNLHELAEFARKNDLSWFVVNATTFDALEEGDGQPFSPTRVRILGQVFHPGRRQGFALLHPPEEIVAFRHGDIRVLSMEKLEAYLQGKSAAPAP